MAKIRPRRVMTPAEQRRHLQALKSSSETRARVRDLLNKKGGSRKPLRTDIKEDVHGNAYPEEVIVRRRGVLE